MILDHWSWSRSPQRNAFSVSLTADWDCSSHFLKKKHGFIFLSSSSFSYLFNASTRLFCTLSFEKWREIISEFSKHSAIFKHREKPCNDDVNLYTTGIASCVGWTKSCAVIGYPGEQDSRLGLRATSHTQKYAKNNFKWPISSYLDLTLSLSWAKDDTLKSQPNDRNISTQHVAQHCWELANCYEAMRSKAIPSSPVRESVTSACQ